MIRRTPVASDLPNFLRINVKPRRTPIVGGVHPQKLTSILNDENACEGDLNSMLLVNEVAPGIEPAWRDAHEQMLKSSLAYFFEEFISGPPEAPYFGKSLVGKHHEEWDRIVNTNDRFVVEAARDHGKSHFFSVAYPIWRAGWTHPGRLGYIFSSTQELAQDFLQKVKDEIETNPKLAHLLPSESRRKKAWTKKDIILANGSHIRARGLGVKVRGGHPYWCIVDDGLSDEDIYSETIRRRHIDYFLSAVVNMIVPGGQLGVVGTPFHFADLYAYLKGTGRYYCAKFPAIDKKGRILFPERYDRKRLEEKKQELKSLARFAREFGCEPLSDEASLFPMKLFEGNDVRIPYRLGLPWQYWNDRGMLLYSGVDFAMSSSASADYTVIITIAVDDHGNRWLANLRRGQGWSFTRQLDEIREEYALMRFEMMHAEANQMQRIFSDEVIRTTDIPIRKFFTSGVQPRQPWRKGMTSITVNKHHLERGVPAMRMEFENVKWRIPRGDAEAIEQTDIWMGEFQAMSWQDGTVISVGEHDDCVMATWLADTAIKLGGLKFSFGEEEQEAQKRKPYQEKNQQNVDNSRVDGYIEKVPEAEDEPDWRPHQGAPSPWEIGGMGNLGY
jgi:hypothetical protein